MKVGAEKFTRTIGRGGIGGHMHRSGEGWSGKVHQNCFVTDVRGSVGEGMQWSIVTDFGLFVSRWSQQDGLHDDNIC